MVTNAAVTEDKISFYRLERQLIIDLEGTTLPADIAQLAGDGELIDRIEAVDFADGGIFTRVRIYSGRAEPILPPPEVADGIIRVSVDPILSDRCMTDPPEEQYFQTEYEGTEVVLSWSPSAGSASGCETAVRSDGSIAHARYFYFTETNRFGYRAPGDTVGFLFRVQSQPETL